MTDPTRYACGKDEVTLTNLTPHEFALFDGDRTVVTIPPSGRVCRIGEQRSEPSGVLLRGVQIPIVDLRYTTEMSDLPDPEDGVLLLVSRISAQVLAHRPDVVFPLDEVRDEKLRIVGCRRLGRFTADETSVDGASS